MTLDQYTEFVTSAAKNCNAEALNLVARICFESQEAKRVLRAKGYGVGGMGVLETVEEVPRSEGWDG